jgi:hypothetical protein
VGVVGAGGRFDGAAHATAPKAPRLPREGRGVIGPLRT